MENAINILHACTIEGDGYGKTLSGQDITDTIKDETLAWIHLNADVQDTRKWLESELTYLDTIIIDALLAEETRPRVLEFDEGALLILRGMNLNANAEPEDMISIRLWVDAHRIISLQKRDLKVTTDLHKRLKVGKGPKNAGDFIAMLCSRLFERMEPVFSKLDDALDNIEAAIIEEASSQYRQNITVLRKQAIIFRRYIAPQKDVMSQLRTSELPWLEQSHKRRLQESSDRLIRYVEDLDTIRERAQIVKDELANTLADKMNKNMYVLSIVAAIFLPLGFLTGLLGVNVGGMPGVENDMAFWFVCLMCMAFIALITGIFKALKWF